jgi:hypothetical protein
MKIVAYVTAAEVEELVADKVRREYPGMKLGTVSVHFPASSNDWEDPEPDGYEVEIIGREPT